MSDMREDMREVEMQYRDFEPDEIRSMVLEPGERVVSVESGTRFSPFRVWVEVPAALAEQRRKP